MDPLPPAPVAPLPAVPVYKDRRGWLIAFGIIEIMIACFFVLMTIMMVAVIPTMPMPQGQPAMPRVLFIMVGAFYAMFAALFVTVGIGSIRARNWARITMIAISSIWLAFGVLGTIGAAILMPTILRQQQAILNQNNAGDMPANFTSMVMVITIGSQAVIMVALPLIFLLFYMGKNVRATCQGILGPAPSAPGVPGQAVFAPAATVQPAPGKQLAVPVIIVSIWYVITALSTLATAAWLPLAVVFGTVIHGTAARLIMLAFGSVAAYCAWSFYKLRIAGWWLAVISSAIWTLSGLLARIRLNLPAFYDEMYKQIGISPPIDLFKSSPRAITLFWDLGWVVAAAFFVLVLYSKRYFPPRDTAG